MVRNGYRVINRTVNGPGDRAPYPYDSIDWTDEFTVDITGWYEDGTPDRIVTVFHNEAEAIAYMRSMRPYYYGAVYQTRILADGSMDRVVCGYSGDTVRPIPRR